MAHKIPENQTWEEFWAILIPAVQPSLDTIAGLTQVLALRFEDDLDFTLSKVWKLVLAAYPGVQPGEANNHTFAYLLRIQLKGGSEYFKMHDFVGLDRGITYKPAESLNMVLQFPPQPRNKTPFNQPSKSHRQLG